VAAWINGPVQRLGGVDHVGVFYPRMVETQVGYFGDVVAGSPRVGEPYRAHFSASVGFPPRGGVILKLSLRLPPGTRLVHAAGVRCLRQRDSGVLVDATDDPGASCPVNPPAPDAAGFIDLGSRDLPQGNRFEIDFTLETSARLSGVPIVGRAETIYGTSLCDVPVQVEEAARPPSGQLAVRLVPPQLPLGQVVPVTVVTQDSGSGALVPGWAHINNYTPAGEPRFQVVPTNSPSVFVFNARYLTQYPYRPVGWPPRFPRVHPTGWVFGMGNYIKTGQLQIPFVFNS